MGQWIISQQETMEMMENGRQGTEEDSRDTAYFEYSVLGSRGGWLETYYDSLRRYETPKRGSLSPYI
jgi:hypothetical protein